MKIINRDRLTLLSSEAATSERLRKNLNLHDDYSEHCQRLFNAMEPGTYIRPHRHLDPPKPECFMAIRGKMALLTFKDDGEVEQVVLFGESCDVIAIDLPAGVWHSLVSLQQSSIFFETKPGPYIALSDKDFAPWAPEENSLEAVNYLQGLMLEVERNA